MSIFNSCYTVGEITSILEDVEAHIHFVGVLGAGMYPLATLMRRRGFSVSGSDDAAKEDAYTDENGIEISRATPPADASAVIYSLAVDESNSEIQYALSHGIPLISRAQLLGAVMRKYGIRIAVSGSHGKSTTTAIIDHVLSVSGLSHTTVSGARLSSGDALYDGGGDVFVAEGCEYKDSFLCLCPSHLVITSVELDHTDYFKDADMLRASFIRAAMRADTVIVNTDDPGAAAIYDALTQRQGLGRVYTYGKSERADYRFSLLGREGDLTRFSVSTPRAILELTTRLMGDFNLYNLTAAVALSDVLGIGAEAVVEAVATFVSIGRRLERISTVGGVPIYYDYAHHPTEIRAALSALKERYGSVSVIFRPHTYSRTGSLWRDFVTELGRADHTVLLDVYPAREEYVPGVDSRLLAKEIPNCTYALPGDATKVALSYGADAVVLMGAGEVEGIKREFIRLSKNTGTDPERR